MQPSKLYVAGPMRGYRNFNYAAFNRATKALRNKGYEVLSPVELEADIPKSDPVFGSTNQGDPMPHEFARRDFRAITEADGIVLLPGWQYSSGVRQEVAVARACGLQAYVYSDARPVPVSWDHVWTLFAEALGAGAVPCLL